MNLKTTKLSSRMNQFKLIFHQSIKLLRFRLMAFHAAAVLWHFWFNYRSLTAVWQIFQNRWDLVEKTYGFGVQYITIWNQVILQVYFIACFVEDILEKIFPLRHFSLKNNLKKFISYYFTSVAFPFSFVVAINFWTWYSIDKKIVDEYGIMEMFIPEWINHGLHTTIIFLVCIEKVLVHRPYPTKALACLGICSVTVAYAITCTILYLLSGLWPYPLIKHMNVFQKILFVTINCLLGMFFVIAGTIINRKIWGEQPFAAEYKDEKTIEKKVS